MPQQSQDPPETLSSRSKRSLRPVRTPGRGLGADPRPVRDPRSRSQISPGPTIPYRAGIPRESLGSYSRIHSGAAAPAPREGPAVSPCPGGAGDSPSRGDTVLVTGRGQQERDPARQPRFLRSRCRSGPRALPRLARGGDSHPKPPGATRSHPGPPAQGWHRSPS